MDLAKISNSELSSRLLKLARAERKITHLVLWHVLEFQTRRIYLDMGYSSMITYLVKHLGYCETSARNRLNAAQLLKKAPKVVEKIESGSINLSQMNQVQRHIRQEQDLGRIFSATQTQELLQKLENQNTFETQKTLAVAFDVPLKINTITKPQKDNSVRIEMTFTEEQFAELEKARQLLAHVCPDGHWPDVITELAKKFNRAKLGKNRTPSVSLPTLDADGGLEPEGSKDSGPLKSSAQLLRILKPNSKVSVKIKTKSETKKTANDAATSVLRPSKTPTTAYRRPVSVKVKRALLTQAKHQCEFVNPETRLRCDAQHALQIDHRVPLALGGSNAIENLRVLCRSHNLLCARRFGLLRRFERVIKAPHPLGDRCKYKDEVNLSE